MKKINKQNFENEKLSNKHVQEILIKEVLKFFNLFTIDKHCRYYSWEHCYNYFQDLHEQKPIELNTNLSALHLGFYLASWGMYRGSSFILQQDYKIHESLIEQIFKNDKTKASYDVLWNTISWNDNTDKNIDEIIDSLKNIVNGFNKENKKITKNEDFGYMIKVYEQSAKRYGSKMPSDTFVTKILMGIFGCIPAYDRFFKKGLEILNFKQKSIGSDLKGLRELFSNANFFREIFNTFKNKNLLTHEGKNNPRKYPLMKIIDMALWQLGIDYELTKVTLDKKVIGHIWYEVIDNNQINYYLNNENYLFENFNDIIECYNNKQEFKAEEIINNKNIDDKIKNAIKITINNISKNKHSFLDTNY